ncbi:MAG: metallophosphoesterase [Candidatus Woesearchaeota archaeon]
MQKLIEKNILLSEDSITLIQKYPEEVALLLDHPELDVLVLNQQAVFKAKSLICDKERISSQDTSIEILQEYPEEIKKREIQDFVEYYNNRYNSLKKILIQRPELQQSTSISRIIAKPEGDQSVFIGMVQKKDITKNKNIILTLEDPTGSIKVLVNSNRQELFLHAKEIVEDEVIGIIGTTGNKIVFANNIVWPEIHYSNELKKCPEEVYVAFISDIQYGSRLFLKEEFQKFISWMKGETGNEKQKEIASKIKYLIIGGDLVDGIGIYPGQEKELDVYDIYQQYNELANYLKQIPPHIKIIISPGNHDAVRLAEPQPKLPEDFAKPLYDLPNIIMTTNPSFFTLHKTQNFPGINILVYHGNSYIHYADVIESIRSQGGVHRSDLIMKFLLKRRHLAPTHGSWQIIPDSRKDYLVIEKVPDLFFSGHLHVPIVANYRNVTMISGSCWQAKTILQEKYGVEPVPGRVQLVNLKTREVKVLKFYQEPTNE